MCLCNNLNATLLHDEIHRGLKSQTPADVHLLNRRTSAGELCRIVKLLTCLLGEGDKFSNQFDSYPSTRIRCDKEIIVQFVNNTLAALKSSFAKRPLISFTVSLYFRVMSKTKCIFERILAALKRQ